jgi:sulfur-carrier protein adenylyltransferase/sulfurtransferase
MGGRSRVAAQLLSGNGFKKVYDLKGGIKAWNGSVAKGPVELNMSIVRGDESVSEIVQLAFSMEHCLGLFYRRVREQSHDQELMELLDLLILVEDRHKKYIANLSGRLEPNGPNIDQLEAKVSGEVMEGGFDMQQFMKSNRLFLNAVPDLLDLAMMLETQALDLYLRFSQKISDSNTRDTLFKIADEEKGHLKALGRLRNDRAV